MDLSPSSPVVVASPRVAVVGGCSLAKLGMKYRGHLDAGQPILEDTLVGAAVLVAGPAMLGALGLLAPGEGRAALHASLASEAIHTWQMQKQRDAQIAALQMQQEDAGHEQV